MLALVVCPGASGQARTLNLRQALDLADQINPLNQVANLRVLEQEAEVLNAKSAYRPRLDAVISQTYQTLNLQALGLLFPGVPSRVGPFRAFDARPVLRQPILDAGVLSRIRAAKELKVAAGHDADTVRETTRLTVVDLYLRSFQAQSRMRAAAARLETARAVLAQARDQEQAGRASKLDVARAEQQYFAEETTQIEAGRDREVVVSLLKRAIGLEAPEAVDLSEPTLAARASLPDLEQARAEALARRPEIRAQESRLRAGGFEEQQARRERWPRLGFQGDFGVSGAGPDRSLSTWTVGGSLTIPLWTSGRIESGIQAAKARRAQAEQQARDARLGAAQEVEQAAIEWAAARRSAVAAGRSRDAARRALELARLRFEAGLTTSLDAVQAQGELAQAEDQQIRAEFETWLAEARLARARGSVRAFLER
ncbi:MAG: TolC family protein [Bryobacteraceae bacterium]|nr:TolC family protein [Bryobacteraceae bacterium]